MVVLVTPRRVVGGRAVVATRDVEVRDRGDAGVDDRHVGIDAPVRAVDRGDGVPAASDARHPGRDRLGQLDDPVRDERDDVRVGQEVALLLMVELGREPAERLAEAAVGLDPVARADLGHDRGGVRVVAQHHDEATGRIGGAARGSVGRGHARSGVDGRIRDGGCVRCHGGVRAGRRFRARGRLRDGRRGRLEGRTRGRFGGCRWGDDREGDEHGEEHGRDPAVHALQCAREGPARLGPLGPTWGRHRVRGPYSPIRPGRGSPPPPHRHARGCSSAWCRDPSRPPSWRWRSTSAGP